MFQWKNEIHRQIAVYLEILEMHQCEITRLNSQLEELQWKAVETDEGDIVSFDDYLDL